MRYSANASGVQTWLGSSTFIRIVSMLAVLVFAAQVPAQVSRVTPVVQAVRKCRAGVVGIYHLDRPKAIGTGIIIQNGYVVTNAHVVGKFKSLQIKLFDGTELTGTVVAVESSHDLAIIQLQTNKKLKVLTPRLVDDLEVGETAIVIGNPYGYTNSVSTGIISALNRKLELPSGVTMTGLIQFDVAINPGSSGGPLLNIDGELIGIIVAMRDGAQCIGFAINADTINAICTKHIPEVK